MTLIQTAVHAPHPVTGEILRGVVLRSGGSNVPKLVLVQYDDGGRGWVLRRRVFFALKPKKLA